MAPKRAACILWNQWRNEKLVIRDCVEFVLQYVSLVKEKDMPYPEGVDRLTAKAVTDYLGVKPTRKAGYGKVILYEVKHAGLGFDLGYNAIATVRACDKTPGIITMPNTNRKLFWSID